MRRLELLIEESREETNNTRYDSNSGISQARYTQVFNNAQDELLKAVISAKTKFLKTQQQVAVVSGQLVYPYPSNIFLQSIDTIQWAQDSQNYFVTLEKAYTKERVSTQVAYAFSYIPRESGFELNPPLSNGQLFITFNTTKDRLSLRSGKVTSLTITSGNISAITIDAAESSFSPTLLNKYNYICVVNRDGVRVASNIQYDSVNATTGVFSLSSQVLDGTISVGDYVVVGKNANNVPMWPDICESFLLKRANYEIKYGDSSAWSKTVKEDLNECFISLMGTFDALSDDISQIAMINLDYLSLI